MCNFSPIGLLMGHFLTQWVKQVRVRFVYPLPATHRPPI
jgi:hypothetical protein